MGSTRRVASLLVPGLVLTLGFSVGCHRVFKGKVTQPNPLVQPTETLRDSEVITIVTGDMELYLPKNRGPNGNTIAVNKRYPLVNRASFTVVSRDRLRFHVQIEHKWREYADLGSWQAWIIDDQGHQYDPETIENRRPKHLVQMWDRERRSVVRSLDRPGNPSGGYGDIVAINDDGYMNRQTLGTLSVFQGRGDFVFYSRDIFTPDVKSLTLVVERRGMAFTFTWKFKDNGPLPAELEAVSTLSD